MGVTTLGLVFIFAISVLLSVHAQTPSLIVSLSAGGDPINSLVIPKGLSRSLRATFNNVDVTTLTVWISSNETLVAVNLGTLTAISEGGVDISAQFANVTTSISVLCAAAIPTEVLVVPATPSPLPQNETLQFRAQTRFSDGSIRSSPPTAFQWGSSRPDLVSIDGTGLATALASSGRTLITATTFDGLSSDPVILGVIPVSLVKISLSIQNATTAQLDGPGHTLSLEAIGEFTDGSVRRLNPLELQWSSSDTTAAIVDEAGVVIGISNASNVQIRVSSKNQVFAQIFLSVGSVPLRSPLDDACAAYRSCTDCLTDLRCTWCVSGSIVSCSSAGDLVCSQGLLIVGLESCKSDNPQNNEDSLRTMDLVGIAVACVIGLFFFVGFLSWVIYLLIRGPTVEVASGTMVQQGEDL